jgi:cell division protein FtsB
MAGFAAHVEALEAENATLKASVGRLEAENVALRAGPVGNFVCERA